MNRNSLAVASLAGAAFAAALFAPLRSNGQAVVEDPILMSLLSEVSVQQVSLGENQAKIDVKLAAIGESLRQARIFVSRAGGKAK